jgi:hypothetical protein
MLTSVSKRMAGEFFGNVGKTIAGGVVPAESAQSQPETTPTGAPVFTAPAKASVSSQDDFLKGIAVGAGLVVLGVVVGRLFGRR